MDSYEIQNILTMVFFLMVTLCLFLAWFFWQRARHRELMLMIEKGMNPAEHVQRTKLMLKRLAFILLGIGIGSAIIAIFSSLGFQKINTDTGTLATFALCIGVALLIPIRSSKD